MKFWKWLGRISTTVFVALLLILWWAHDSATDSAATQDLGPRPAPTLIR